MDLRSTACLLLVVLGSVLLTGCELIIRNAVNDQYPPVSLESRQLGAIKVAQDNVAKVNPPSAYAFLSAEQLTNYVQHVLANPIPLDASAKQFLAASPAITNTSLEFGKQQIALRAQFQFSLTGQHRGLDISGIDVSGELEMRLFPEFVPSPDASVAAAFRMRPSLSSAKVWKLDFSRSRVPILNWFEQRKLLSGVINEALRAFKENISGTLHLDLPMPMEAIELGRKPEDSAKDGFSLNPATIAYLQPRFPAGALLITSKGVALIATARLDVLDPASAPKQQVPPDLPPETLADSADPAVIEREFDLLEKATNSLASAGFGTAALTQDNTLLLSKKPVAASFNAAFKGREINVTYTKELPEQSPQTDDDRLLTLPKRVDLYCDKQGDLECDPKGTCAPYLLRVAAAKIKEQTNLCDEASNKLGTLADKVNDACNAVCGNDIPVVSDVCKDLVAGCNTAKAAKEQQDNAVKACRAAIDGFAQYVGGVPLGDFLKAVGLDPAYTQVCSYYDRIFTPGQKDLCESTKRLWKVGCAIVQGVVTQLAAGQKLGEIDWRYAGVGPNAIRASASIPRVVIAESLDRLEVAEVSAGGNVTLEGWADISLERPFLVICPNPNPPRIPFGPTTVGFELSQTSVGGAIGIDSFYDDSTGHDRRAFYIKVDAPTVKAKLKTNVLAALLRDSLIRLGCVYNGVGWGVVEFSELITLPDAGIEIDHAFEIERKRIGWADSEILLPIRWSRDGGQVTVLDSYHLPVTLSLTDNAVVMHTATIAPVSQPTTSRVPVFTKAISYWRP